MESGGRSYPVDLAERYRHCNLLAEREQNCTTLWLDWNLFSGFCTNLHDFRQLRQLNCAKLKKNSPIWLNLFAQFKKKLYLCSGF